MSHVTQTRPTSVTALAPRRERGRVVAWVASLAVISSLGACSLDGLLKSDQLPQDVTDPAITETPAGARAAYLGTLARLQQAFGDSRTSFIYVTGLLSDELTGIGSHLSFGGTVPQPTDLRRTDETPENLGLQSDVVFTGLNNVRQRALQAIGLVSDYLPEEPALRAHLYAVEGYAEVLLAELFCSGIPLSTVDYKGDFTLKPGSSTADVFAHAAALFDTALALAAGTDSTRILHLSRVGQARAFLGRGDYTAAAAAAAAVPDTFRYTLRYLSAAAVDSSDGLPSGIGFYEGNVGIWSIASVADGEGTNGLPYRTSNDPRTRASLLDNGFYHPIKYRIDGTDTIVLASGVEARLIVAEAALREGRADWLDTLNALRQRAPSYHPSWPVLPDAADPGNDAARVSLLFRERAFWLFLTGHRQGDMRRLVRPVAGGGYGRLQAQVYPVGVGKFGGTYGSYVDAPIPWEERERNPLFTGCLSRD